MENDEIVRRQAQAESDRQIIQDTWDIIEEFVVPYRGEFFRDQAGENEIDWKQRNIYDTTAVSANQTLASSIHGAMTNPSYRWFALKFRDSKLNDNSEAKRWLEEVANIIYFSLQESNFNLEISETYIDLTSFGSSALLLENAPENEDFELIFKSIPLKECFFEQDHKGQVCNFFRKLQMSAIQMVSKFGKDGVSPEVYEKSLGTQGTVKMIVIFCVYKRPYDKERPDTSAPMAPDVRPYGFKYIIQATKENLGDGGGYYEMPLFMGRWRKTSESMWGNSPAMVALPDILTLNQLVQLILRAAEKVVDPATLVTERGLLSDIDLEPAGLTVVRTLDDMKPYESRARFDVSELQRDKLQVAIRDMFHVNELQLKDSPAMTATEVQVRYELMQRLLGPTAGRLQNDLFNPMIERAFLIHLRDGKLPERPAILDDVKDIDIQYTGPLARAQKSDEALATERWLQGIAAVAEMFPDARRIPDVDAIVRGQAENLNVPAKYARSQEVINTEVKQEQAAQAQAQQMAMLQQGGETAKSLGEGAAAMEGVQNAQ